MLNIEFCDLETQNAIYKVACKYEGFVVDTLNEVLHEVSEYDNLNYMEYFWKEVEKKGKCGYGLEKAISDYLLLRNDFMLVDRDDDIFNGQYSYLIDDMECEVFTVKHWEDNKEHNININESFRCNAEISCDKSESYELVLKVVKDINNLH